MTDSMPHNPRLPHPDQSVKRVFYDTEFLDNGRTIELVSIGAVAEGGDDFYAISTEFNPDDAIPWVKKNVLNQLPSPGDKAWRSKSRIRDDFEEFLRTQVADGGRLELWAWYAAYDHVALAQLWGDMRSLPRFIPRFTKDLRQRWDDLANPPLPDADGARHDALTDARHNLARWTAMEDHRAGKIWIGSA